MKEEILRMEHVYVKRAGKYILGDFKLNIYKGEMVILFGLPGSGLEELGMVLAGEGEIEKGRILLDEKPVSLKHRFSPEEYGIYSVFNENNLIPELSVAENLFFGWQKNIFSFVVSRAKCERLARDILMKFRLDVEVSKKARQLTYFEQIMIKFIKAYVKGAKLLIVHEIIESIYGRERIQVISILKKLQQDGIAILWLNQRIGFVREIADRIIVLRSGKNVKTFYGEDHSLELLVKAAADTRIPESVALKGSETADTLLELKDVGGARIRSLTMTVKRGTIIGIWANDSIYLQELIHLICGGWKKTSGEIRLQGRPYQPSGYREAVKWGVEMVDCMWYENHLLPDMSILDNMMLKNYWMASGKNPFINKRRERFKGVQYSQRFGKSAGAKLTTLSGDQQRMMILERCLDSPGKLIAIIEPFIKLNYLSILQTNRIFQQLLDEGKTLMVFSVNYQDLSNICEEIIQIGDGHFKS